MFVSLSGDYGKGKSENEFSLLFLMSERIFIFIKDLLFHLLVKKIAPTVKKACDPKKIDRRDAFF